MATYTVKGGSQHIDRPIGWHTWIVELTSVVDDEDPAIVVDTAPAGTVFLDASLQVLQADTAGTSSACTLTVGDEPVVGSTNAKTVTTHTAATVAELGDASVDGLSAAQDITLTFARTGAATTLPIILVSVLCGRVEY